MVIHNRYNADKNQQYHLVPKLTEAHVNPNNVQKMKVKLATQVLSATVSAAFNTYTGC